MNTGNTSNTGSANTTMSENTRKILGIDVPRTKHFVRVVRRAVPVFHPRLDDSIPQVLGGRAFDGATGFMC